MIDMGTSVLFGSFQQRACTLGQVLFSKSHSCKMTDYTRVPLVQSVILHEWTIFKQYFIPKPRLACELVETLLTFAFRSVESISTCASVCIDAVRAGCAVVARFTAALINVYCQRPSNVEAKSY